MQASCARPKSARLAVGSTRSARLVLWRVASGAPGGSLCSAPCATTSSGVPRHWRRAARARKGVLCGVRMRMVAATVTESGLQAAAQHPSAAFTARDDALAWQSAMHHGAMPLHVFGAAHTKLLGCDRASYGSMPCDSASSEWHASSCICNSRLEEQRASSSCATPMRHSGIAANVDASPCFPSRACCTIVCIK